MKNTRLSLLIVLFHSYIFGQALSPKEILFKAEESVQNVTAFEGEFSCAINRDGIVDNNFNEQGKFHFERDKSDRFFGGKYRLETQSYSILYNLEHAIYIKHPRKKIDILHVRKMKEEPSSIGFLIRPFELMKEGLQDFVEEPASSFSIESENSSHWLIKVEKQHDGAGFEEWSIYILINRNTLFVESVKRVFKEYGSVVEREWKLEKIQTSIANPEESLEHITLPMTYKINYKPQEIISEKINYSYYLPTGMPVPEFSFPNLSGKSVALSDMKDKLILLDFWEYWCGGCIESIPKLKDLHEKYVDDGLVILGIFAERKDIVKKIAEKNDILYPNLQCDKEFLKTFRIRSRPTAILIKNGVIVYAESSNNEELEIQILKHLN